MSTNFTQDQFKNFKLGKPLDHVSTELDGIGVLKYIVYEDHRGEKKYFNCNPNHPEQSTEFYSIEALLISIIVEKNIGMYGESLIDGVCRALNVDCFKKNHD